MKPEVDGSLGSERRCIMASPAAAFGSGSGVIRLVRFGFELQSLGCKLLRHAKVLSERVRWTSGTKTQRSNHPLNLDSTAARLNSCKLVQIIADVMNELFSCCSLCHQSAVQTGNWLRIVSRDLLDPGYYFWIDLQINSGPLSNLHLSRLAVSDILSTKNPNLIEPAHLGTNSWHEA